MTKKIEATDRNTLLGQLAVVEAQIKDLNKEREELRAVAVQNGWARWTYTIRMTAPSLTWWKENRPTVWKKYAKETQVKKFELT